jgi:hypothetical protein
MGTFFNGFANSPVAALGQLGKQPLRREGDQVGVAGEVRRTGGILEFSTFSGGD